MAKISTEDCKNYLDANFCSLTGLSTLPVNWKRLNKTGKKGEPVLRRFLAKDTYPVVATVIEDGGVITGMRVEPLAPWHPEFETLEADFSGGDLMNYWFATGPFVDESIEKLFKASDFCFALGVSDGELWIALTPVSYFKSEGCMYDQQLDIFVAHLSDHLNDEVSEATFVPSCTDYATVIRDLAGAGFVVDPDFIRFMGGTKPLAGNEKKQITHLELVEKACDVIFDYLPEESEECIELIRKMITNGEDPANIIRQFDDILGYLLETDQGEKDRITCGIEFDLENVYMTDHHNSYGGLVGPNTTDNGVPFIGGLAGGDWESAVFFAIWYDGKDVRVYVPRNGNCYNTSNMKAFGNSETGDMRNLRKRVSAELIKSKSGFHDEQFDLVINVDQIKAELNQKLR